MYMSYTEDQINKYLDILHNYTTKTCRGSYLC